MKSSDGTPTPIVTDAPRSQTVSQGEQYIRVRIKPLDVPPVKDGLVIGNDAAIGVDALQRMLQLVSHEKFDRMTFPKDDIIGHVVLRDAVMRKLSPEKFAEFIVKRIKPVMTASEILMLDVDVELVMEEKF